MEGRQRRSRGLAIVGGLVLASAATAAACFAMRVEREEITFSSAGTELAGSLFKPRAAGIHPAVVIVHDDLEDARDGSQARLRAERFARSGIAAFVYDRRGRGASRGETDRYLTVQTLAADAVAAIDMLRSRADIDASAIGIAGHAGGGWVAPLAATLSEHVAFVAVSSAPVITPDEQSIFASKARMEDEGRAPDEIAAAVAQLRKMTAAERARFFDPSHGEATLRFLQFDPEPVWERVRVPVFAIWGADDEVVPARRCRRALERALINAENQDATLEILEGVNHDLDYTSADEFMIEWALTRIARARR